MRKRVIFVGDRIALGVICSLLLLIGYSLLVFNFKDIIIINPWAFFFLGISGLLFFVIYILTNDEFYYSIHIFFNTNFLYVVLIWTFWMVIISSILAYFYGWQHILEITILYLGIYVVGYFGGRMIWSIWTRISVTARTLLIIVLLSSTMITTTSIASYFFDFNQLRKGIFALLFGIGSLCSIGLNAWMLQMYLNKKGNDVVEDPPSLLVIIGIVNTLILSFVFWFLMIIFVPLIAGSRSGGKKSGSSGGSGSLHTGKWTRLRIPSVYRTRKYYFFGPPVNDKRPSVNYYWTLAMGDLRANVKYKKSEIEEAKNAIIAILFEEEIVPTQKYLQLISKIKSPLLDFVIDELINENKIKYVKDKSSHGKAKGFCLSEDFYERIIKEKGEIDPIRIEKEFNQRVDSLLEVIRQKQPIKNKSQLWDLAIGVELKPKWKIMPTLNKLIKEKKITYSRKTPRGYYVKGISDGLE